VLEQQERIAHLDGDQPQAGDNDVDEILQLRAIIEAQDAAMEEQRRLLESHGSLVDELNRQLQAQLSGKQREEELEALVELQLKHIAHLEASAESGHRDVGGNSSDEVQELHAIIEAQEEALNDQRQVIQTQSSLIDELNSHIQSQISGQQRGAGLHSCALAIIPEADPSEPPMPSTPLICGTRQAAAVCDAPRRRAAEVAAPLTVVGARSLGGSRSQRAQQLVQHKACASTRLQQGLCDLPRPRPNSVLGGRAPGGHNGNRGTPRARSTTMDRLTSRGGSPPPMRSSSPRAAPRQEGRMPRRTGGPLPPSLPLLRQEA